MFVCLFVCLVTEQNKTKAMKVLRARLYDIERQKAESERTEARRKQVSYLLRFENV